MTDKPIREKLDALLGASEIYKQAAIELERAEDRREQAMRNYEGQKRNTLAFLREKNILAAALQWMIAHGLPAEFEAKAREALREACAERVADAP